MGQLVPYTRTACFASQAVIAHHTEPADRLIIVSSGRVAMCVKKNADDLSPVTVNDKLCVLHEGRAPSPPICTACAPSPLLPSAEPLTTRPPAPRSNLPAQPHAAPEHCRLAPREDPSPSPVAPSLKHVRAPVPP